MEGVWLQTTRDGFVRDQELHLVRQRVNMIQIEITASHATEGEITWKLHQSNDISWTVRTYREVHELALVAVQWSEATPEGIEGVIGLRGIGLTDSIREVEGTTRIVMVFGSRAYDVRVYGEGINESFVSIMEERTVNGGRDGHRASRARIYMAERE